MKYTFRSKFLFRQPLANLGLVAGAGWAVFVFFQYSQNQARFLVNIIRSMLHEYFFVIASAFCLILLLGIFIGYLVTYNNNTKRIIATLVLVSAIILLKILSPAFQSEIDHFGSLSDSIRVVMLITGMAFLGAGVGYGINLSKNLLSLRGWVFFLVLPFIFISIYVKALGDLLTLAWVFLLAYEIGFAFIQWLSSLSKEKINCPGVISIAIGLTIMMLAVFGLGLLGNTNKTILISILFLTTILLGQRLKKSFEHLCQLPWDGPVNLSVTEVTVISMSLGIFIVFWICALAPEVGADAIGLRIAAPAIWLKNGRITGLPQTMWSYNFIGGEILHLLLLPLTGLIAAKVLQFGLSIVLCVSSAFDVFNPKNNKRLFFWLFPFWSSTLIWWQMSWGFVDITQLFFFFAGILALRRWLDETNTYTWLMISGILGGTATVIKLGGIITLIISSFTIIGVTLHQRGSLFTVFKKLMIVSLSASFILFPFFINAYKLTGNPIFPFANQIFKSPLAPLELPVIHFGVGLSFPAILTVPWGLFFNPPQFGSLGTYHPYLLAFAPLGLLGLVGISSRKEWLWVASGLLAYIGWIVVEQNSRYSFFAFYPLALGIGLGMSKLIDNIKIPKVGALFQCILLVSLLWGFNMQVLTPQFWMGMPTSGPAFPTKVVFGIQSESEYLANNVRTYMCAEWINRYYGENAIIWQVPPMRDHLYFEATTFSLPHSIFPVTAPLERILRESDFSKVHQLLLNLGYTHIIYDTTLSNWAGWNELEQPSVLNSRFADSYLELECADRGVRLYKIVSALKLKLKQEYINLISNPDFDKLDEDNHPLDWQFSTPMIITRPEQAGILLLNKDTRIYQNVNVSEGQLYDLTLNYTTTNKTHQASAQINWLDAQNHLLLSWKDVIYPTDASSISHHFQTAPSGAQTAVIYLSGSNIVVDHVDFHQIHPQK